MMIRSALSFILGAGDRGLYPPLHSGRVLYIEGPIGKIFIAKKYLVTPSVFKLPKWFLHQNGVEFNKKSKSDLTKLWPVVGR